MVANPTLIHHLQFLHLQTIPDHSHILVILHFSQIQQESQAIQKVDYHSENHPQYLDNF